MRVGKKLDNIIFIYTNSFKLWINPNKMAVQDNPVLYKDPQIRIEFNPKSPEDHIIYLSKRGEEDSRYHIPRGCLEELAKTRRDEAGSKMRILNVDMVRKAYRLG